MKNKIFKFFIWTLLIFNLFNTSIMAYQYFILNGRFLVRPSWIIGIPLVYFDFLKPYENSIINFFYYNKDNIDYAYWPSPILRRSLTSFLVLTFLSYIFLFLIFKSYRIKNIYLKILGTITSLILCCWFQFLSVQYVGRGEKFFEYYSIWVFREREFEHKTDCYNSEFLRIRNFSLDSFNSRVDHLEEEFFNCHEVKDDNKFKNCFTKEYELKQGNTMRVLNGIVPFFNLDVAVSTM